MPIVKIRTNRQVTIPKPIFEELGLEEGQFVEVTRERDHIVIKPKRLKDTLTPEPEEEELVARGFEQLKRGDYVTWEELKHELEL